ncbi:MAG: pyridoxine 5'-phosphate synthase [Deltaproteobacteria bacterium]|nr:pyridoxine 5'-phosphate synthase [Deltaproteobacteria bacterium]
MKRLHVNIDHCATVRQARGTTYPDPVWAATVSELAGAHGITAHLREDRRHIQDRDIRLLRQTVRSVLNLEMAATPEMVAIALDVRPDLVTLVPERREERTTEGGLDLRTPGLPDAIRRLREGGIEVSLFVDPDRDRLKPAAELGATIVELHTGDYCEARGTERDLQLQRLAGSAAVAAALGLRVAAGHGLDYPNVRPVAAIPEIEELNIGHAIIGRAIFVGLDRAVRDMLATMNG